jgi:glutaryl-CoA dehydrogenase
MPIDFYDLDSLLTEDERMVKTAVRQFVDKKIQPVIEKHYREATFPNELIPEFGELGLLGANLTGYGCPGMGPIAYGVAMIELERGDSGIRSFASVQGSLAMYPIWQYGNEQQKEKWLPSMAKGTKVGCFGLTEPDAGSDPGAMRTRAKKNGTGWILNGRKRWITNGTRADVAVVWANTGDKPGDIRGFLVEKGMKGFVQQSIPHKHSFRASDTAELIFEDVALPAEALLPGTEGLKSALGCLSQARFGIAWGVIGAAQHCLDVALDFAKNRVAFGRPIAATQLVQAKLAVMATEITKAQLLAWRLGKIKESGKITPSQISMAKMNNVQISLDVARAARDILAANGIHDEYPVMRHMNNLETVNTYEGTHDIHKLVIGEALTGFPAYRMGG